jgi:acetyl esterase/lipase
VVTAAVQAAELSDLGTVKSEKVVYHKVGDLELTIDLYLPDEDAADRPAVVWIHGGAWRGGTPTQFQPQSQSLASQGLVCASVRYRLSGEAKFPACLNDVKCAVRFLRSNADKYGIDPDRIAVGGGSAGGHLAAMVGTTPGKFEGDGPNPDVSSRANLLILFNPALDLVAMGKHPAVQGLLGTESPSEKQLAEASPIRQVSKDVPPTLILHGDQDRTVPYEQAVAFRDALAKKGVKAELFTAQGKSHGWFNRGEDLRITLDRVVEFLKANGHWRKG